MTTLAISLPTVVGLAVWPCVRLDGFHVVVGDFLERLDGNRIGFTEVFDQAGQVGASTCRQGLELIKTRIGQSDEPGDFDLNAAVHVALLAHERAQGIEFAGVTAIQRRQGGNGGEIHAAIVVPGISPESDIPNQVCPKWVGQRFT
jgi:hypothetical protein